MTLRHPLVIDSGCHVEVHQCRQCRRGYGTSISLWALFPGKELIDTQIIVLYRFFYFGIPGFGIPEFPGIFRPPPTPNCFPDYCVRADFSAPSTKNLVLF